MDNQYTAQGSVDDYSTSLQADSVYESENLNHVRNPQDYYRENKILNKMLDSVTNSEYYQYTVLGDNPKKNKINKDEIPLIYTHVSNAFNEDDDYTTQVQIFAAFCEIFDLSEKKLWNYLPTEYQETILKELDRDRGIFTKKRIKQIV